MFIVCYTYKSVITIRIQIIIYITSTKIQLQCEKNSFANGHSPSFRQMHFFTHSKQTYTFRYAWLCLHWLRHKSVVQLNHQNTCPRSPCWCQSVRIYFHRSIRNRTALRRTGNPEIIKSPCLQFCLIVLPEDYVNYHSSMLHRIDISVLFDNLILSLDNHCCPNIYLGQ